MDILYRLPLPNEVCSKIFFYTCKSPHNELGVNLFKIKSQIMKKKFWDFYHHDIPEMDKDVIHLDEDTFGLNYVNNIPNILLYLNCFYNLTEIWLHNTDANGNIAHLESLHNLTFIGLCSTGVYGDISHLESLHNLTTISLYDTDVYGDISHLESLLNLTDIRLYDTLVSGDIAHLKSLLNLTHIWLSNTGVYGDKEAFKASREWVLCYL